jgi:TPR repeat protein
MSMTRQLQVTPAQVAAAQLLIDLDRAQGRISSGLAIAIANARTKSGVTPGQTQETSEPADAQQRTSEQKSRVAGAGGQPNPESATLMELKTYLEERLKDARSDQSELTPEQRIARFAAIDLESYEQAANTGDASAQNSLGLLMTAVMYPPDIEGARYWFERAAEVGHTTAQFNLGLLLTARMYPPDIAGARHWYEIAASAGDRDAKNNLGLLLADRIYPPDIAGARHWLEQAANAGHDDAQNNLGLLLADRIDPPDIDGARHWFERAANVGNITAQFNLGLLLAERLDPPDLDGARHWFLQAVAANAAARNNMELLPARPSGAPDRDRTLAPSRGASGARTEDAAARTMPERL